MKLSSPSTTNEITKYFFKYAIFENSNFLKIKNKSQSGPKNKIYAKKNHSKTT